MYARSTTFRGSPDNIDTGIAFVENDVWPMLDTFDGCRGHSLLIDRETGLCIASSSWESEELMHAADASMRPLRDRGRDILGGSMQMDEWEIALMHRAHHGERCRVSWLQGDMEAMAETFRIGVLPNLEQTAGFCSASLLLNTAGDVGCATTVWESQDAMAASRMSADRLRQRVADEARGEIVDVHEFELAHAHLHVPEMA